MSIEDSVDCASSWGPDDRIFLAFLFPHQRVSHGEVEGFLVSIDVIEAMVGVDFIADLEDSAENAVQDADTFAMLQE